MYSINVPTNLCGPIKIKGSEIDEELKVPLSTYETTLWPSVNRGAKLSRLCGGIKAEVISDKMTRSILLETDYVADSNIIVNSLHIKRNKLEELVEETSSYAKLIDYDVKLVGNLIFIRFEFGTGNASGHNMVTKACDNIIKWLLSEYKSLKYVSISGNYCTDKKVSAINSIRGRGKKVIAELEIPDEICKKILRCTPEQIVELNIKKNLIGGAVAGSLNSANAHFANMLLAVYLATGQDAANIVEGSQGITFCQTKQNSLYFSVTVPNIIVGTVGNGKHLGFVKDNLAMLGCLDTENSNQSARRLSLIIAATILCGELSLMAAQTNYGELVKSHMFFERENRFEEQ